MGFFDDLRVPHADWDEEDDSRTPAWWAAPEDALPGVVPLELVLAENGEAAVVISRISAYPAGFGFDAELLTRKPMHRDSFELIYDPTRPKDEIPPELVRLGIAFSDGRRASSFGEMLGGSSQTMAFGGEEAAPDPERDIFMTPGGGGGGPRHSTNSYWVWPLPPTGALTFACEWPAFEIGETTVEVDSSVVREASERSRSIWSS